MHVFLPSFYCDPDFLAVQACLCMYKLLLKYHDPQIAIYLEENNITPEIYAFNWFITLFSSKMPIDLVYKLWIQMIQAWDMLAFFNIAVALVLFNKDKIRWVDKFELPIFMANLTFEN